MSFDVVVQAIKDNPALAAELNAAKTPAERAAVLDAHGIARPTPESTFPEMTDVSGGSGSMTQDTTASASASAASA